MKTEPDQKRLKSLLRREIRSRRSAISDAQRIRWDTAINQAVNQYSKQLGAKTVAAYMAFDGEPNLMPVLAALQDRGATLALPIVLDAPGKAVIGFRKWSGDSELRPNRYGISEPAGTGEVRITDIDLVLVPLVGWDTEGGRLGMGASFYDRLFQPYSECARPVRMGIGYELQKVERIPRDPWDVRLHVVLSENGWFTCEQ